MTLICSVSWMEPGFHRAVVTNQGKAQVIPCNSGTVFDWLLVDSFPFYLFCFMEVHHCTYEKKWWIHGAYGSIFSLLMFGRFCIFEHYCFLAIKITFFYTPLSYELWMSCWPTESMNLTMIVMIGSVRQCDLFCFSAQQSILLVQKLV